MLSNLLQGIIENTEPFLHKKEMLKNGILINYLDLGVIEIIPQNAKNGVIISSGIHGNETAPIELVDQIAKLIATEKINLNVRLLLIIAHKDAIIQNKRYIDTNLNRLFLIDNKSSTNQNTKVNIESILAERLKSYVHHFFNQIPENENRWHFDLHASIRVSKHPHFGLIPHSRAQKEVSCLVQLLNAAKIDAVLFNDSPSSTFSWWTSEVFGALSVTLELGQVSLLYSNDLSLFSEIKNIFIELMTAHDELLNRLDIQDFSQRSIQIYQVSRALMKNTCGFTFHFDESIANFTWFPEAQILASEDDGTKYQVCKNGESVIFPNANVEIGHRACLLIQPIDIPIDKPIYVPLDQN